MSDYEKNIPLLLLNKRELLELVSVVLLSVSSKGLVEPIESIVTIIVSVVKHSKNILFIGII